jgi:hypothetical protein
MPFILVLNNLRQDRMVTNAEVLMTFIIVLSNIQTDRAINDIRLAGSSA